MRSILSFLLTLIITLPYLNAQTISTVDPDTGIAGQSLTVSIYGQSTTFTQGTGLNSWFDQGTSTLNLNSINPFNDSLLTGIVNIPINAANGYWNANVYTTIMGTITKINGFYIISNPLILTSSQTNVTCAAICDGTATIVASGCAPYTYLWNDPSAQTNATAVGLCAGSYSVAVTGSGGCSSTASVTITQPALLLVLTSVTNDTSSCTGSGTATGIGGTPPYMYMWDDPSSQTNTTATALCAGTFHVTVTDNNGCTAVDSVEVLSVASAAIIAVSPNTAQQSQSLTVNIYGQNTMFTSGTGVSNAWFNRGASVLNLSAITVVSDTLLNGIISIPSNADTGFWNANVTTAIIGTVTMVNALYIGPNGLTLTLSKTDALCGSVCDGTATVAVTGCSGVYTYLWNDLLAQTTAIAVGLCGGTYTVTVSDNTGCTSTGTITISQPTAITSANSSTDDTGGCNGSTSISASGGITPYTYLWNDPMAQTTSTATGLCGGSFQVTVTDNVGCTSVGSATVLMTAIDSASPDIGTPGDILTVSIYGQNTMFTQATTTPNAWINQGASVLNLSSINIINDNLLTGILNIPSNANPGFWDVNVFVDNIGTLTKTNGFYMCDGNCVWPGDANSDNIANNLDLLPIGLGYGTTGPVRMGASNNWVSQPASDWTDTLSSGVNYKHVDSNGDGIIDDNDTLAIALNYGSTHNKTTLANVAGANAPQLYLEVVDDTVVAGAQLSVLVKLGTSSIPADSIYGLAFTVNYDPALVVSGTANMIFNNSWIGTIGTDMISTEYDSYSDGEIDVAIVRTDQTNAAGFGQIAELILTTVSDLPGAITSTSMSFTISDLTVIANNESVLSTGIGNVSLTIEEPQTGPVSIDNAMENGTLSIYPNPNTGRFTLQHKFNEQIGEVLLLVYQINGQKVFEEILTKDEVEIDLAHLSIGIYYLQLRCDTGILTKKIVIE